MYTSVLGVLTTPPRDIASGTLPQSRWTVEKIMNVSKSTFILAGESGGWVVFGQRIYMGY